MAACVPTLPQGYKWLRTRLKPGERSSAAHLPLAENPELEPSKPRNGPHSDHDISNALRSETEPAGAGSDRIRRTIRVDVERNAIEDGVDEGKPTLRIDLGPQFESFGSLWAQILEVGYRSRGSEDTLVE